MTKHTIRKDIRDIFRRIFDEQSQKQVQQGIIEKEIKDQYGIDNTDDLHQQLFKASTLDFYEDFGNLLKSKAPNLAAVNLSYIYRNQETEISFGGKSMIELICDGPTDAAWNIFKEKRQPATVKYFGIIYGKYFSDISQVFFQGLIFHGLRYILKSHFENSTLINEVDCLKRAICDQMKGGYHKFSFQKVFYSSMGSNFCLSRNTFANDFACLLNFSFTQNIVPQWTKDTPISHDLSPLTPQSMADASISSDLSSFAPQKLSLMENTIIIESKTTGIHTGVIISYESPKEEKKVLWYIKSHQGAESRYSYHNRNESTKFFPNFESTKIYSQSLLPGGLYNTHFLNPVEVITYSIIHSLGYGPEPLFFVDLFEYSGIRILTRSLGSDFQTFFSIHKKDRHGKSVRVHSNEVVTLLELALLSSVFYLGDLHGENFGYLKSSPTEASLGIVDFSNNFGTAALDENENPVTIGMPDGLHAHLSDVTPLPLDSPIDSLQLTEWMTAINHIGSDASMDARSIIDSMTPEVRASSVVEAWKRLKSHLNGIRAMPKLHFITWPLEANQQGLTQEEFFTGCPPQPTESNAPTVELSAALKSLCHDYIDFFKSSRQASGLQCEHSTDSRTCSDLFGYVAEDAQIDPKIKNPDFLKFGRVCHLLERFVDQIVHRVNIIDSKILGFSHPSN